MQRYNPKELEPRWQKIWDESGTYTADLKSDKPKYIAMSMFNYPSGAGIHIGHAMNYTISDVKARFKRQQGYESYHPVGWDAFGLPGENYAIKTGVSPQESMANIIPMYHKQYKAMGWSNDWEKEIATHLPEYYKWTQWIFAQMHKNGLAYQDSRLQWWCPIDKTVLANEQVIDGKCWRHDGPDDPPAEKREVKQWFFKITDYADELLEAIDGLDWTESVKLAQKNWIGKKSGIEITYEIENATESREVICFTTRPDTNFGATFIVISPEHELAEELSQGKVAATNGGDVKQITNYIQVSRAKSEVERQQEGRKKTGVFTGLYAVNSLNNRRMPIWIADFVLAGFGTGAVVGVPGHDVRDFEFALAFGLPIERVVVGRDGDTSEIKDVSQVQEENGKMINSEFLDGLDIHDATEKMMDYMEAKIMGKRVVTYRMRDWSVSRQRYWGAPIPIIHCTHCVPEDVKKGAVTSIDFADHDNFLQLISGDKTAITRAVGDENPAYSKLQVNDIVKLVDKQTDENVYARITDAHTYDNLNELFKDKSILQASFIRSFSSKEELKNQYNANRPGYSNLIEKNGAYGWRIALITEPVLVSEEELPVILPELDDFSPTGDGRGALARATDWLKVDCPQCGGPAERETDTMDTYVDSSWYMYRYFDPRNQQQAFDPTIVKKWEPIDFYNGADHATAHLLYARFIGHFFKKLGLVNEPEPFKQFLFNGKVTAQDGTMFSKSKGNGVDPLEIIEQGYGADALRIYLMFAAPLELWVRWDPRGVPGMHRFLSRIWNLVQEYLEAKPVELSDEEQRNINRTVHFMIKKVTEDIEHNHYNTAIAAAMACTNDLYKLKTSNFGKSDTWQSALEALVACVAPFAPHASEELWHQLGHTTSVHRDSWPKYDEKYLEQDQITIAVQVNGKLRGEVQVAADAPEEAVVEAAKAHQKVAIYLANKTVKKAIYVPSKLINFVI
ncbi:MAG TPA: class I tRNA ligase family protein [Candidatus Saccharimonadales bacterium]|nr:class I tRNA ligase family protein [Candidatus Saccharimonadales bacterium]